jgi:hypothetical protein
MHGATLGIAGCAMGEEQGFASGPGGDGWRDGKGEPRVYRRGHFPLSRWYAVA